VRFFSKHRLLIILLGLDVGLVFFIIANSLNNGSLPRDLLINLSAGAITISLTVVLVDFLLNNEYRLSNKDAIELATGELHYAALLLLVPIAKLYKVELKSVQTISEACPSILKSLEEVDMKAKNAQVKEDLTKDFLFALERALIPLNEVQKNYAYALPNSLRGTVLKLIKHCLSTSNLISQSQLSLAEADHSDTFARHLYLGLFRDTKKLVEYTQKL